MNMAALNRIVLSFVLYFLQAVEGNKCDKLGTIIYEDLGCKPITEEGKACPVKYECDLEVRKNTCLFRDLKIPVEEQCPNDLINGNCQVGCFCRGALPTPEAFQKIITGENVIVGGEFICASLDCPEYFGIPKLPVGCHRIYELNKCCSTGYLCDAPEKPIPKCAISSTLTLKQGQKFYPENTCLKCICPDKFNGKFEAPHCMRNTCSAQIRYQKEISSYCAPYYSSSENDPLCCPEAWVCPLETDKIVTVNPKADQKSDLRCTFGRKSLKLGEGLETKTILSWSQKEVKAKCECILPPFLTCKLIKE